MSNADVINISRSWSRPWHAMSERWCVLISSKCAHL